MSRSIRRQKSEAQLLSLEEQFTTNLVAALRECSAGTWGMFGRNDLVIEAQPKPLKEMLKSTVAERLLEDGSEIEKLRRELGNTEPFEPFKRYLEYRQMGGRMCPVSQSWQHSS